MPRYTSLIKYSTEAMVGVRGDGYASRAESARAAAEADAAQAAPMTWDAPGQS